MLHFCSVSGVICAVTATSASEARQSATVGVVGQTGHTSEARQAATSEARQSATDRRKRKLAESSKPPCKTKIKTKKQTCRKGKPRGRRPKKQADDISVSCAGEKYRNSTDDWLQCSMPRCKLWYELSCTGLQGMPRTVQNKFVCEQCK